MSDYYVQCLLERHGKTSVETQRQTSWIPEKIAVIGKTVRLKEEDGTWDEGWIVKAAYNRLPWEYLNERSRDYTRTRNASDI